MIKNRRIYRKVALERLTSPEQLDRTLRITSPHNWASLLAVYVFLGGLIIWSSITELPIVVRGVGVIADCAVDSRIAGSAGCGPASGAPESGGSVASFPELLVYVPALESAGIGNGVSIQFRPVGPSWNKSEVLQGRVVSISNAPFAFSGLASVLQDQSLAKSLMEHGPVIKLRAALTDLRNDRDSARANDPSLVLAALVPGTTGEVKLIVGRQKPIVTLISSTKAKFRR